MPNHLRSLPLAFALVAIALGCASAAPPERPSALSTALGAERLVPVSAPIARERHALRRAAPKPRPKPTLGERAAAIALTAVGVPYRWGGSSRASGFDCSGLVYWAYGRLGIQLPHSSYALYGLGRQVARSRLKPGDLLFFYGLGHVGVYVGGGRMVHAPRSGRLVEVVALSRSGYGGRLVGARRVVPT